MKSAPLRILALYSVICWLVACGGENGSPEGQADVTDSSIADVVEEDVSVDSTDDVGSEVGGDVVSDGALDTDAFEDDVVDAGTDADVDDAVTPEPYCGDGNVDPGEQCDAGAMNGLDGEVCTEECIRDLDRDGSDAEKDCDDTNPDVFPDAEEVCNGIDDNCNGATDEVPDGEPACGIPEILRFSSSRDVVPVGGTISLEWEVRAAIAVSITADPPTTGLGEVNPRDLALVTINSTTTFTLQATNLNGTSTDELVVEVVPVLEISSPDAGTDEIPAGLRDAAYEFTFEAVGGRTPYEWSLAGELPDGVDFDAESATLSGAPVTDGTFEFEVSVQDALSDMQVASRMFTWRADDSVVRIISADVPDGTAGVPLSGVFNAVGGIAPYRWTWSGEVPDGLSISEADGVVSGTPTSPGSYTVTVRVEDSSDPLTSDELAVPLIVIEAAPEILTETLPDAEQDASYSMVVEAIGGTPPLEWSFAGLPPGLAGDPSLGTIDGTPIVMGSFDVSLRATDALGREASLTLPLVVGPPSPRMVESPLANALEANPYFTVVTAESGTPPYSYALAGGRFPDGVLLEPSGALTGTPTESGDFTAVIEVTDDAGLTGSSSFDLRVDPLLVLEDFELPDAFAAVPYEHTIRVSGGVDPIIWSVLGALPAGLSLDFDGRTATIVGTPVLEGTFSFAIQVRDGRTPQQLVTDTDSIVVGAAPPEISEEPLPPARVGSTYNQTVLAIGGTPPYSWGASGLPAGLALSPLTGAINGTPVEFGTFELTVSVTDSLDRSDDATLELVVRPPLPSVDEDAPPDGVVGREYAHAFSASNGTPPYVWSVIGGALPDGLTLNSDGTLTGTPSGAGTLGFTIQVSDAAGEVGSAARSIVVYDSLDLITESLPNATRGSSYTTSLSSTGGKAPVTWSLVSTTIPGSVNLDPMTGELSVTASDVGAYEVTVGVSDAVTPPQTAEVTLPIVVDASAPVVDAVTLPRGEQLVAYAGATLTASDGTPPLTWSIDGGELPPGITLDAHGILAGTPTLAGAYAFTARVTDDLGRSATRGFTIDIDPPADLPEQSIVLHSLPDVSAFGTLLPLSSADDAVSEAIAIDFTFDFYGTSFNQVIVSTNGVLYFGAGDPTSDLPAIPDAGGPNGFIAPFADNLDPGDAGEIYYATIGLAPYRIFLVQWKDVDFFEGDGTKMNFAVALYETTHEIQILHGVNVPGSAPPGSASGATATIGLESPDGTSGVSLSFDDPEGVVPGQVWRMVPNADRSAYLTASWESPPGQFEDISATGTHLTLIDSDDDSQSFSFGFGFEFYGTRYTSATASSNGYLAFTGSATQYSNRSFPTTDVGAAIAPFWDDLSAGSLSSVNPDVFWEVRGTAPYRRAIVQWTEFRWLGDSIADLNFQVVLHETTNHIGIHYGEVAARLTSSYPGSASVGINAGDGTRGEVSVYNEEVIESGDSVYFMPRASNDTSDYVANTNEERFVDIRFSGTERTGIDADDTSQSVPLPFDYEHMGNTYSSILISSNGYATFGTAGNSSANVGVGTTSDPDDYLSPFWDDLVPGDDGAVYTYQDGFSPLRRFVIQWDRMELAGDPSSSLSFQLVLDETGGAEFVYGSMSASDVGAAMGGGATIGAEDADGANGAELGFGMAGVIHSGAMVRIVDRE